MLTDLVTVIMHTCGLSIQKDAFGSIVRRKFGSGAQATPNVKKVAYE